MAEDSMEQEVQTEEEFNEQEEFEKTSEDTVVEDNSDSSDEEGETSTETSDEDEGEDITREQLDAMDDEQFTAFLNSGKLPTVKKEKVVENGGKTTEKPSKKAVAEQVAPTETKQTQPDIDYKSAYDSIFRPFKANGKEITPRTVQDVISLMQMGANYTKKMQAMAPMKKAMASLTNADIKQDDLNFLIDVHKGDREAIKKLLQKHKVDPMDLDLESTNYVPNNNIASDEDVTFNDVIQDLGDNLPKITDIVNKTWDAESKKRLLKEPQLLRKLGEEVSMGRFDAIQKVLEEEKVLGRYQGVSDLDAYIDIVTKYVQYQNQQQQSKQQTQSRSVQPRATKQVNNNKAKAAPVRSTGSKQGSTKFTAKDLLSGMSDEEIENLSIRNLI